MLILGVDTSGKNGSVALVRCDSGSDGREALSCKDREGPPQSSQRTNAHTLELVPLEGETFSAQLVPRISALLQKHSLAKQQIDAFAVVTGPGSFTGLRVGLAAVKALAEILQKPIGTVSLLEAVALEVKSNGRVMSALDAGRGEIYVGTFDVLDGSATCISEEVLSEAEFTIVTAKKRVATPQQKIADRLRGTGAAVVLVDPPRADAIAVIGFRKLQSGETVSPEALDATYIRRSEAEIKFDERKK